MPHDATWHTDSVALPTFSPMVASTEPPKAAAEWAFEPMLDGWRALRG